MLAAVAAVVVVAGLAAGGYALASGGGGGNDHGTEQADGGAGQTDAASRSSTTRPATTTTLPDTEPARPTAAQKRDATLDGTFTLRSTVSKSDNITAPVGKSYTSALKVTGACTEPPCEVKMSLGKSGQTWQFDGRSYRLHEEFPAACFGARRRGPRPQRLLRGAGHDAVAEPRRPAGRTAGRDRSCAAPASSPPARTRRPPSCGTSNDIRPVSFDLVATPAG